MRSLRLGVLLLPCGVALACGGRYQRNGGDGYGGAGGGGKGGEASAASGKAGTQGTAGGCACDPVECSGDESFVLNPDGCCYHCELDLQVCSERQRKYVDYRTRLVQENVDRGCNVDSDCIKFEDLTGCSPICAFAIPRNSRRGIDDRLYAFASEVCNLDCPTPATLCAAPTPASCVMGRCL